MSDKDKKTNKTLSLYSIFSSLSLNQQQQIVSETISLSLKAGETLINEGEAADSLFFLQQGKLIVFSGKKPIAEISPGESIGEIAFLTGGKRTATVLAARNSKLLQLDQATYNHLINDIPELTHAIIKSLANRLTASNNSTPELEPKVSRVVSLIPVGKTKITDDFIDQLLNIKNNITQSWKTIHADELNHVEALTEWIEKNEDQSTQLILIASCIKEQSEIALAMAEHADKNFLIIDATLDGLTPISVFEETIYQNSLLNNVDLVLLRKNSSIKIDGTAKILNGRQIHLHHHVALNQQTDLERVQRFIAGKATGLVLCGGGAFGTAHLGMIKALQEQGYHFDIVGGTSVGSAMAALYAMELTPDNALEKLEEMFIREKALSKYSIPYYSFLDHKYFDDELKKAASEIDIEDLPINYFAVATNLSRNQLHVMQKGPLWQAVRSSCSLPGILPPYINDDGDVLIDGALMDNTPIKTLRSLKTGPNVIMNFSPLKTWRVGSEYAAMPRGWGLIRNLVLPKRKSKKYYPTIFAILSRAMITNTEQRFSEIDKKDDIFLEPKRLRRMGIMNWKKSRLQFELSYEQMNSALCEIKVEKHTNKISALREIAEHMKR